jgi:hypothetical protein
VASFADLLRADRYRHLGVRLSLRQMKRALEVAAASPGHQRHAAVQYLSECCLASFFPKPTADTFAHALRSSGLVPEEEEGFGVGSLLRRVVGGGGDGEAQHEDGERMSGRSSWAGSYTGGEHQQFIPRVIFFDNDAQEQVMESMKQQLDLGHHLLLVGNQGVGKNKLCDRLLQKHSIPRQYIQLHRFGLRRLFFATLGPLIPIAAM